MEQSASFGNWVTQRRATLRLTRAQLARSVACATITLRKIEEDARRPSPELARKLAEHLAIEPAERERFIQVARGERGVNWLHPPEQIAPAAPQSTQLPLPLIALIGRAAELADLSALFARADVRLVTLTGPGGSGKTHLALQLAHDLAERYPDGAVFIDLAPVTAADQVQVTIAQTLGVKELIGTALVARVREHLLPRQILLVLDNFEHLVTAAPLIAELLTASPGLAVLVTSRIRLKISGEREYPVLPLSEPAAIALFAERAQAARPTFALTEADTLTVAELCRQLDCLPLALELAAARIRIFTPQDLRLHLQQSGRLSLVGTGMRDRLPRQQTIRATIAWSYRLLEPAEQTLFRRLAIFVGGWTFTTASAICNLNGDLAPDIVDLLQALADQSLIRLEIDEHGAPRFQQLETIREYASELLAASGEQAALQHTHALFFYELAEAAAAHDRQPDETHWYRKATADYGNIQAALGWAIGACTTAPYTCLRPAGQLRRSRAWRRQTMRMYRLCWQTRTCSAATTPMRSSCLSRRSRYSGARPGR